MPLDSFEQAVTSANNGDDGRSASARDDRTILRGVRELTSGETSAGRPRAEDPAVTPTAAMGIGGDDGPHGLVGFLRERTMYNNVA